ncbi:MAG: SDR family oxidoreductase [Phycisphaerales bacterium]|nr:SDR family oxidoreductase [Phycisphaerales bacterium]
MQPLNGRVGLITGATAGIGLAAARRLARDGARLILNARRRERLDEVAREIGADRAFSVAGDCASPEVIEAMLRSARDRFGPCDLVVVNAGRGLKGSVTDSDPAQWEEMVRTNVLGAARLIRASAESMLAGAGQENWQARPRDIIVIGSIVGRHVSPFSSMYGGTKFAVAGMVEGVRRELGPKGIRLTLVEPAFVESEFQGVAGYDPAWFKSVVERIGPVLAPEDIADAIAWVASLPARVNVSNITVRPTRQEYP